MHSIKEKIKNKKNMTNEKSFIFQLLILIARENVDDTRLNIFLNVLRQAERKENNLSVEK